MKVKALPLLVEIGGGRDGDAVDGLHIHVVAVLLNVAHFELVGHAGGHEVAHDAEREDLAGCLLVVERRGHEHHLTGGAGSSLDLAVVGGDFGSLVAVVGPLIAPPCTSALECQVSPAVELHCRVAGHVVEALDKHGARILARQGQGVALGTGSGAALQCNACERHGLGLGLDTAQGDDIAVVASLVGLEGDGDGGGAALEQGGVVDDEGTPGRARYGSLAIVGEVGCGHGEGLRHGLACLALEGVEVVGSDGDGGQVLRVVGQGCGLEASVECCHGRLKVDACRVLAYGCGLVGERHCGAAAACRYLGEVDLILVAVLAREIHLGGCGQILVVDLVGGIGGRLPHRGGIDVVHHLRGDGEGGVFVARLVEEVGPAAGDAHGIDDHLRAGLACRAALT